MPNEFLRDRIQRKLANLPDERLYQVLDFVEFLETKYAPEPAASANFFQRFAEGVEDRLRAGRVSAGAIAETMNLMHRAMGVLNGVAAAGKSVASDIAEVAQRATATPPPGGGAGSSGSGPSDAAPGGAAPASGAGTTPAAPRPAAPGAASGPGPTSGAASPPPVDRGDRPA
ncbi:MAG TPA: hypothetical protein VFS08_18500 [Gemmatimonadaceae bacterium]|nr:hypothetical protein [Gemmatimonadaceae bacterium]